jgi:mannosyltransferase OCH1-like enzyme
MIPRRIICTHKTRSALPEVHERCLQQMKGLHPEWEVLFFSDGDCEDFVARNYPTYLELYRWYPKPVMKADLFRILAVKKLGGFFLDMDMWLVEPLDELCAHQYFRGNTKCPSMSSPSGFQDHWERVSNNGRSETTPSVPVLAILS